MIMTWQCSEGQHDDCLGGVLRMEVLIGCGCHCHRDSEGTRK